MTKNQQCCQYNKSATPGITHLCQLVCKRKAGTGGRFYGTKCSAVQRGHQRMKAVFFLMRAQTSGTADPELPGIP
ncbi:hypothetical protein, partial [Proteus mirabilis]|uniref:hypothetical protein n=1 Tax=Proteus mirabilis TaxID=584 RepID=UPI0036CD56C8